MAEIRLSTTGKLLTEPITASGTSEYIGTVKFGKTIAQCICGYWFNRVTAFRLCDCDDARELESGTVFCEDLRLTGCVNRVCPK